MQGGFAKCYELTNLDTKEVLAGKVVSKQTLAKHRAKEKVCTVEEMLALALILPQLTTEIKIHQSVNHKYVVGFRGFFEDRHNVYILLELCAHRVCLAMPRCAMVTISAVADGAAQEAQDAL